MVPNVVNDVTYTSRHKITKQFVLRTHDKNSIYLRCTNVDIAPVVLHVIRADSTINKYLLVEVSGVHAKPYRHDWE